MFAAGPTEDLDGGCTELVLWAEGSADIFSSQRTRHIMIDSGLLFVGNGLDLLQRGEKLDWHEALKQTIIPALRVFKNRDEIRAQLGAEPTEGLITESHELVVLLRDLQIMQLAELQRPTGKIDGAGVLFRPEVGDGNYPLRLFFNEDQKIVGFQMDFWPLVHEM